MQGREREVGGGGAQLPKITNQNTRILIDYTVILPNLLY